MDTRKALFSAIFCFILSIIIELLLRATFFFYGYPFIKPGNYLYSGFYPLIEELRAKNVRNDDDIEDVLILGGSVISTPWSNMESRLDTILRKKYGKKKRFAFYNVASAGHTSMDNLIKYKSLPNHWFDLVIFYEAINENRANCIPEKDFRIDYSHMKWYNDIYRLQNHPEINYTIIPYAFDVMFSAIGDILMQKNYTSREGVEPEMVKHGSSIKTAAAYKQNLGEIIALAKKRREKLLLIRYASYFPKGIKLTGGEEDNKYYACCYFASKISQWGDADNVKKGILIHNQILTELARKNQTYYYDMAENMPQEGRFFRDVCHLSGLGAQTFAQKLAGYIADEKLLQ
jgi:lysophospholipase L1-like esterase